MSEYNKTGAYKYNDENVAFDFATSLRAKDKVLFVKFVTDSLVDEDYNYMLKDMIFDFGIIYIFTDVDVSYILSDECPDQIDMIEDILDETNIVEIVKANAEYGLIEELRQAVDYNIEYKTGIHRNVIAESLSNLLDTVERKMSDIDVDGMMEMAQMVSGVSGELTPERILEAYANSDMYKKQHKQMFADKVKHDAQDSNKSATTPILSPTYEV